MKLQFNAYLRIPNDKYLSHMFNKHQKDANRINTIKQMFENIYQTISFFTDDAEDIQCIDLSHDYFLPLGELPNLGINFLFIYFSLMFIGIMLSVCR